MIKYIVYKTTNLINGKIYVGVHRTNPDVFDGYIGCGITQKDLKKSRKRGFPAAVRKYGYENFKRETLFTYPDTAEGKLQAYKKEEEIVTIEFVKRKDTYNITRGGRWTTYEVLRKKISQYTLDGKFIRTWDSIKEAESYLSLTNISAVVLGKTSQCGGFQWKKYTDESDILPVDPITKTVYQFDLQGNLLKVWKSATEASLQYENQNAARKAICGCCNKVQHQAYGYFWSYKCKFESLKNNHLSAVASYNDDGEFLKSFTNIKEAADYYNIKSPSNIIAAIKGTQKRCGKLRWRYFYGNTANIKPLR